MTASYARPSDVVFAISAAVLLHALLFAAAAVIIAAGLLSERKRPAVPEPPAMVTVEIRPEMFERLKATPAAEEQPRQRFAKTNPNQESQEAPENAAYLGERNTKAASELPPDPNAPAVPSQDGREPRRPGEVETFDSNFQPGESSPNTPQPPSAQSPPPGDPLRKPTEPTEVSEEPIQEPLEEAPPEGGKTREEVRRTETQIPVPKEEEQEEERDPETLPKEEESKSDPQSKNQPGGTPDAEAAEDAPPPREDGFQSEARKTKLRGSIGRKGTTSLDVEDSPIGRYQAELSRAVEQKWQISCLNKRELLTPGTVTIRFLVDEKGRVSGMRFLNGSSDMEIELGITMSSIRTAKIPAMPKQVVKQLNGDPLELIYNFYF